MRVTRTRVTNTLELAGAGLEMSIQYLTDSDTQCQIRVPDDSRDLCLALTPAGTLCRLLGHEFGLP